MRYGVLAAMALAVAGSPALAADGQLGVKLVERNGKVVITDVLKGSGADGVLQRGDILYKVDTTRIGSIQDAMNAKAAAANNTDVPFIIERDGNLYDFNGRFEKGQAYGAYSTPVLQKR